MKLETKYIYLAILVVGVIVGAFVFGGRMNKGGTLGGFNPITTVASSSHMIIGITTATGYGGTAGKVSTITSTTTFPGNRTYFAIVNTSGNYVCVNLSPVPPINCEGIFLAPFGGSFEMSEEETGVVYQGTITAIANSATSTVTYVETR